MNLFNAENPIFFKQKKNNVASLKLNLNNEKFPIEYKIGIYDDVQKKMIDYEPGANHMIYEASEKGAKTIINHQYNVDKFLWKGAGINIPVFSIRTATSWGSGDFSDLHLMIDYAASIGIKLIQLLPVNDTTSTLLDKDSYPYSAISSFALHPKLLCVQKLAYAMSEEIFAHEKAEIERLALGLERANDRLQVLDKQKSEFVSIASHQLRSPLTAIRGYVSMMTEGSFGKLPDKASEALGRIAESTVFMASSIDDFLEVSRIESGNMKYDYRDVNLKEQAGHIVDDLRTDALHRGLLLMFRSDLNGTGLVRADAGKTQQILHNLINNALKYTPKGSVTVYAHDDVRGKKMYVDIIDTGLGLSSESLQKLFGKFARAKVASSANIMGTGLGLFVAREMARAMGGDISVTSDGEGLGSTFTIVLPLI